MLRPGKAISRDGVRRVEHHGIGRAQTKRQVSSAEIGAARYFGSCRKGEPMRRVGIGERPSGHIRRSKSWIIKFNGIAIEAVADDLVDDEWPHNHSTLASSLLLFVRDDT